MRQATRHKTMKMVEGQQEECKINPQEKYNFAKAENVLHVIKRVMDLKHALDKDTRRSPGNRAQFGTIFLTRTVE